MNQFDQIYFLYIFTLRKWSFILLIYNSHFVYFQRVIKGGDYKFTLKDKGSG